MPERGYIKTHKDDANRRPSFVKHEYTRKEIAEYLGIHYTTVSNAVSMVEK